MRLRNKKTGEIVIFVGTDIRNDRVFFRLEDERGVFKREINSLAELNEEWEDVPEEPKEYWCIDWTGGVNHITVLDDTDRYEENKKEIGNYFSTREEAEKAVEKLKAWKRLKDNGFKFNTWGYENEKDNEYTIWFELNDKEGDCSDLDLLFGGEE